MKLRPISFVWLMAFVGVVLVGSGSVSGAADVESLFQSGDQDQLLWQLEESFRSGELRDPDALWLLSSLYLIAGDGESSLKAGRTAFDTDELKDALAYRRLGVLMFQVGEYDEAVQYLREASRMDEYDHWARYHLVLTFDHLINRQGTFRLIEDYERTLMELQRLERQGINVPSLTYYYIGLYYAEKNDVINAKYYYGQFVKKHEPLTQEEARFLINAINYLKSHG